MGQFKLLLYFFFVAFFVVSCHKKELSNPNKNLTLEDFSGLRTSDYMFSQSRIQDEIARLVRADKDSMASDYKVKNYYANGGKFLWIDRLGLDARADTAVARLTEVSRIGFSTRQFRLSQITEDLDRMRSLRFDTVQNSASYVMARLEYNLTKAYLRYAFGQRFGFVNPYKALNKLDVRDSDSLHVSYRTLFYQPMQHADKQFYASAFRKIKNDSVGEFLHEVEPQDSLYLRLRSLLNEADEAQGARFSRTALLVNMERCRWRLHDNPYRHKKYVLVNIPSFQLKAVDGDSLLVMRIGCGTFSTKTPLLFGQLSRMDVNPQWIIPRSIIKKSIAYHVGDTAYFMRHNYFVRHRKTGREVPLEQVTTAMLGSPEYLVIQRGGEGNSLGRIIFRFSNPFSIYLHDTSSKGFFGRENRGVSHGCIRVEKPLELAIFLLPEKKQGLIDKIAYSMRADVSGIRRGKIVNPAAAKSLDRSKLVGSVPLEPTTPVFIVYYTLYPDAAGKLHSFADVYGYDRVIHRYLENYL